MNILGRYPLNVPGKYYINDQCTDCDLCRETAPMIFARDDKAGHSYTLRQPQTPEEIALCQECVEGCPTEGVSDDGDTFDWAITPIHDWPGYDHLRKILDRLPVRPWQ